MKEVIHTTANTSKGSHLAILRIAEWGLTVHGMEAEAEQKLMHAARADASQDGLTGEELQLILGSSYSDLIHCFMQHPNKSGAYTCRMVRHPWAWDPRTYLDIGHNNSDASDIIDEVNNLSGRCYRKTPMIIKLIGTRLAEDGVKVLEVVKMLKRQWELWGTDPVMCHYFRPTTLFRASKFGQYYDERNLPVKGLNKKPDAPGDEYGPNGVKKKKILPNWA